MLGRGLLVAVGVLLCAGGCKPPAPKGPTTYPVKGTVVYADGKPYPGGAIEFRMEGQTDNVVGMIGSDGTFTLKTMLQQGPVDGAPAGTYQATITPLMGDQVKGGPVPVPIALPGEYKVEARESNEIKIQVPGTGGR
jgi:hypothetical protein